MIESKSEQQCQLTSSPAVEIAAAVYDGAEKGHVLAVESQSELVPMWLVRVVEKHDSLEEEESFDDWGVTYSCEAGERALEVTRLFISSSKATNTFCDDVQERRFFVPALLLRHSDLSGSMERKENTTQTDGNNRSRAAVEVTGDGAEKQPECYYELAAEKKRDYA